LSRGKSAFTKSNLKPASALGPDGLKSKGIGNWNTSREKVTGARTDRRELNRMLGKLTPGDVVTVTRINHLARTTFDLFGIVKRIVDAKAAFRSSAEPWADTGTSTGRLMLAVLGGLADVERDLIRTRTTEGRSRAKAQGKHSPATVLDHASGSSGGATPVQSRLSGLGAGRANGWQKQGVPLVPQQ
jgi:hypothetical protein